METLVLQIPPALSIKLGWVAKLEQSNLPDSFHHLPPAGRGEVIAWKLHSEDLIGFSLCDAHIAIHRNEIQHICLWTIYPAKGAGSVSIAIAKSGGGLDDPLIVRGYDEWAEQWFASILDSLAGFFQVPLGEPLEAFDC